MKPTRPRFALGSTLSCTLAMAPPMQLGVGDTTTPVIADGSAAQPEPTPEPVPPADQRPSAGTATTKPQAEPPAPRLSAQDRSDTLEPTALTPACRRGKRDLCKQRTVTGAVLMSLGLAALGGGIGLMTVDDKSIAAHPAYARTYRPAGLVLIGSAILAVTMGAFLVGDAVQRRRGTPRPRFARRSP
jgi:hypothetical protein